MAKEKTSTALSMTIIPIIVIGGLVIGGMFLFDRMGWTEPTNDITDATCEYLGLTSNKELMFNVAYGGGWIRAEIKPSDLLISIRSDGEDVTTMTVKDVLSFNQFYEPVLWVANQEEYEGWCTFIDNINAPRKITPPKG